MNQEISKVEGIFRKDAGRDVEVKAREILMRTNNFKLTILLICESC